jgi:hypothetical protein
VQRAWIDVHLQGIPVREGRGQTSYNGRSFLTASARSGGAKFARYVAWNRKLTAANHSVPPPANLGGLQELHMAWVSSIVANGIVYPTFHTICPRPSHKSLVLTHDPCSRILSAWPGRRARRCPVCVESGDASVTIWIERRTEAAADGASSKTTQSWNAARQAPHIRLVSLSERDQTGSSVAKPTHKTRCDSTNNQPVRNRVSRHAARNT